MASDTNNTGTGALTRVRVAGFRESFDADPNKKLVQNVVTQHDVNDIALSRSIVTESPHSFSIVLDDWGVTNQARSGRCWMFAGLNLCRVDTRNVLNVKEFEFSQNYLMFWDKLERANFVLEAIIETAGRPVDDRTVAFLLRNPISDGGQWDMFTALVAKHGVVPKTAMEETESSANSARMNSSLNYQIRQGAKRIRHAYVDESGLDELRSIKDQTLKVIYDVLCIHLGTPPTEVDWQWKDKDGEFTRAGKLTPQDFAAQYLQTDIHSYVSLVHDPRETSPEGATFTVEYLGNVVDAPAIKYLNVDIQLMKDIALKMLQDGKPVWMGCDTGKQMHRDLGLWDADLFDYASVYGANFSMNKAERLEYHQTAMTHAMMFTGVDVVDGVPRRWRVENSWDDKVGNKGFFLMNDSWFAEYMFEIAVPREYLPPELQKALELEPVVLPAWDPMGSLANR
ncbi:MAG: C1 family peptidase [Chloroflexota bacterium]|nr:C1 family peptidase [Dehalococcoidia bacterium]MEC8958299.1 C1 family peptidase [Chloroflexota bacterium]MCS5668090.1 C1 family peptidase [Dehalococcoidia bacterium]MEC9272816.1 C1 family peptidase [Chloroflexota bacterium]MED5404777.1 C1 family peptidase [Chloroflexota bacterium]|tara:strand:- start:4452 stop:5813 length:1362 start_codon:yes stop_codon:yes gene_type:complete